MAQDIEYLRQSIRVATRAMELGGQPFGAVLVGPDNQVIGEQGNINVVNHAEDTLCRTAYTNYSSKYLEKCTMYASFEPCCMCAAACYWAGIGKVVYGMSQKRMLEIIGTDKNFPTISLPCRDVFAAGQRNVEVLGPFPELENEIMKDHFDYWKKN